MNKEYIKVTTADGSCDCVWIGADRSKPKPAVILLMDAFGLRPYLEEMSERLAAKGYCVLTPNLFYRIRPAPVWPLKFPLRPEDMPEARKQIMELIGSYDFTAGIRDIGALLDFLQNNRAVAPKKVALTGYCMGGGMAIRIAGAYSDHIAAAACFHGGNLATDAELSPHRAAPKIKARLYFGHADNDASLPQEQQDRLKSALDSAQVRYEAEVYPGAIHGFTMADLPAYSPIALERHWEKLLELLSAELPS